MAINDIYRGDTVKYKFVFSDGTTPVDVTSWEIWFTAKAARSDVDGSAVIQKKSIAGTNPSDDPVNGILYLELTSTDTNVDPQDLYYDFQRVIPAATPDVKTLDVGRVSILEDITRSTS